MMITQEEDWLPPSPDPAAEVPFQNLQNILLDDVEKELLILKSERPITEQRTNSVQFNPVQFNPVSAVVDLSKVLGCMDCKELAVLIFIASPLTQIQINDLSNRVP